MKLAIFSDTHLGFSEGTGRENESFENTKQAIEIILHENVDAILMPGDIFDHNVPSQETLLRSLQLFATTKNVPKSNVKIFKNGMEQIFSGIPIFAIHGTHEYRTKDFKNVLEVMQEAGYMIYLRQEVALLEKNGEKVAVHGFSGVPEKYAQAAFKQWNPQALPAAKNILILHQSINEYLPFDDPMVSTLEMADFPFDFDLIVNGHLHWSSQQKHGKGIFLLCGSTIVTQMKNLESEKPKGVHVYDTATGSLQFFSLPNQRKLFYHKLDFKNAVPAEILQSAEQLIQKNLQENPNKNLKPMIRLKFVGILQKGFKDSDVDFRQLEEKYKDSAILSIFKEFGSENFAAKIAELRQLQQERKSITALGLEMLEKNLTETQFGAAFDTRRIFELLAEGEIEKAQEVLLETSPQTLKPSAQALKKQEAKLTDFV